MDKLLPTTLVGSYPQPGWLVNRGTLLKKLPPRIRLREVWRIDEGELEAAQDAATLMAVQDQVDAGIDIVTDGEIRRESYFNRFATALEGVDVDLPGQVYGRDGTLQFVPRVTGPIRRPKPVQARDVEFLRRATTKPIKMTVPGPFTMMRMAKDEYYNDKRALVLAYARAVNEELRDLKAAGADVLQIDDPFLPAFPDEAELFGVEGINASLAGIAGPTVVHLCFGYGYWIKKDKPAGYSYLPQLNDCIATAISIEAAQPRLDPAILERLPDKTVLYGVIDLKDQAIEAPEQVADRLRAALRHIAPERLVVAPDCGMKYLSRDVALGKMKAMVAGAAIVRAELGGAG
jgi:5-methyltetrahydropteroyltriglutamate--homocysteine methyltransferase